MAIAVRTARTTWEGPLASGTGTVRMGSGAAGELPVTWAAGPSGGREDQPGGAGGRGALRLLRDRAGAAARRAQGRPATAGHHRHRHRHPRRGGGIPTIVSSHIDVTARVAGLDPAGFDAVIAEASELCPVSRLFAGAKVIVDATLEPAP